MSERTVVQLYEAALRRCRQVATANGDHAFEVSPREELLLRKEPMRSNIGTMLCRDVAGKPKRFCGLIVKVKEQA